MSAATVPRAGERTAGRVALGSTAKAGRPATRALAVYLGLSVLVFLPAWLAPGSTLIGPSGDPAQASWFLSWTPHAVAHAQNPLTSGALDAPGGANLMWNTLMPLPGLLLWPVAALFGPSVAYDVLATLAPALSAWACFVMLRRWVRGALPAFVGGLLYGFSPFLMAQSLGHPDIALAAIPPLVALLLDEIVVRQQRSPVAMGAALGLLCAVELAVFEEILTSMAVAAAVVVAVLAALHRERVRQHAKGVLRALTVAVAVFIAIAAAPLAVQFLGSHSIHGTVQPTNLFVSDLLNFAVPTSASLLSPAPLAAISQHFSGNIVENGAYLGLPLLVILGVTGVRFRRDPLVRTVTLSALALAILSLGPSLHVAGRDTGIPMPWVVIQQIPLLGDMLPSRMVEYVDLLAAVLVAVFVERVALRSSRRAPVLGLVAAGITLLPLLPVPTSTVAVPAFFTGAEVQRVPEGSVVLVAPFSQDWNSVDAMLWQQAAGMRFRMPEGYVIGPGPDGGAIVGPPASPLSTALRGIAAGGHPPADPISIGAERADLARWQVQTVIAGPMPHRDLMLRFLTDLLGRPPLDDQGVAVWWNVRPAR